MALNTRIILSAQDRGVSKAFSKVAKNSTKTQKKIFGVNAALKQTDNRLTGLSGKFKLLAGAGGIAALTAAMAGLAKQSIAVKIDFDRIDNTLLAVTGSSKAAKEEFGFLEREAERLGLQLRPLAQTYSRLTASTRLIGISTNENREIFTAFSEALTAFGADNQTSIRVFAAIEQIANKGVVSMEELRQQLGEALPGALNLAARSMNLTVSEFSKLVAQGKVASKDFLLPFARTVREELGKGAVTGAKLLNAEMNRLTNATDKLFRAFAEGTDGNGGFAVGFTEAIKSFREAVGDKSALQSAADFGKALGEGVAFAAKAVVSLAKALQSVVDLLPELKVLAGLFAAGKLAKLFKGRSQGGSALVESALGGGISPTFGEGSLRSRASTGRGATRASFATRAFIASPERKFSNRISLDNVASGKGFSSLTKFGKKLGGVGRTLLNFGSRVAGAIGPLGLLAGGAATAARIYEEFKQVRQDRENSERKITRLGQEGDIRRLQREANQGNKEALAKLKALSITPFAVIDANKKILEDAIKQIEGKTDPIFKAFSVNPLVAQTQETLANERRLSEQAKELAKDMGSLDTGIQELAKKLLGKGLTKTEVKSALSGEASAKNREIFEKIQEKRKEVQKKTLESTIKQIKDLETENRLRDTLTKRELEFRKRYIAIFRGLVEGNATPEQAKFLAERQARAEFATQSGGFGPVGAISATDALSGGRERFASSIFGGTKENKAEKKREQQLDAVIANGKEMDEAFKKNQEALKRVANILDNKLPKFNVR